MKAGTPRCAKCGADATPESVRRVPIAEIGEFVVGLERRDCPSCSLPIPVIAVACSECGQRSKAGDAGLSLPDAVKPWMLGQTFEDSELVAPLSAPMDAAQAGPALAALGCWGRLDAATRRRHPEAEWELEGRVCTVHDASFGWGRAGWRALASDGPARVQLHRVELFALGR